MSNLIVISLIIFSLCMWVLIVRMSVRDRWRIKFQKLNKWISWLACDCLARSNLWKEPRVEHITRRWKVVPGWIFHDCLVGKANLWRTRKTFCLARLLIFQSCGSFRGLLLARQSQASYEIHLFNFWSLILYRSLTLIPYN